jgi:hypothetical protein
MQFSILGFKRSKVLNRLLCVGIKGVNNCCGVIIQIQNLHNLFLTMINYMIAHHKHCNPNSSFPIEFGLQCLSCAIISSFPIVAHQEELFQSLYFFSFKF